MNRTMKLKFRFLRVYERSSSILYLEVDVKDFLAGLFEKETIRVSEHGLHGLIIT